jgi:putative membrane protein
MTVGALLEEVTDSSIKLPVPLAVQTSGSIHEADTLITTDIPWRGLHPTSLLVNLVPRAWNTVRSMWPILLVVVVSGQGVGMRFIDLVVILMFALMSVWNTFIHWATLRYRIHHGRLEIKQGLLNRQTRTIDPDRIQNIELVQNLFHTWSGLVELRIDTAGEQTTEGLLSALSVEEATELRTQLASLGSLAQTTNESDDPGDIVVDMGISEILAFGLTQRTIGTVAVITAIGLEVLSQTNPQVTTDIAVNMQPTMIIAAFMLAFVASWAVSALTSLFRYFGYKMLRLPDVIRTEQGLTTRRRVEIPLSKVQLVRADEPLMRRIMGYGTILIETAGLGFVEGEQRQAEGMVPMVDQNDLGYVASTATPHAQIDPWTASLKPAHPRSLYRAILGSTVRVSILIALGMAFFGPIKWALLAFLPIAWMGAWLDWKKQGWLVTPTAIVSRRGFFNRRTFIISRDKLQSIHLIQGPFMRLHGLSQMVVSVAGSRVALPETGHEDTQWLTRNLSRKSG